MTMQRGWRSTVAAAVVAVTLGTGGAVAGAAPGGFAHGPAGTTPGRSVAGHGAGRTKSAVGSYDLVVGGNDFGLMVLGSDQSVQINGNGDTGVWVTSGTAIAISITNSTVDDVGCTFSATVGKKGLASAKKPGSYICPGNDLSIWYATRAQA
jgi:hypothetical protein